MRICVCLWMYVWAQVCPTQGLGIRGKCATTKGVMVTPRAAHTLSHSCVYWSQLSLDDITSSSSSNGTVTVTCVGLLLHWHWNTQHLLSTKEMKWGRKTHNPQMGKITLATNFNLTPFRTYPVSTTSTPELHRWDHYEIINLTGTNLSTQNQILHAHWSAIRLLCHEATFRLTVLYL